MSYNKTVFIVKKRETAYSSEEIYGYSNLASGVWNSAKFVSDMLNDNDMASSVELAIDNNCIDRIVTETGADLVIIEAFWVVPEKFKILQKLHPNVTWMIRNHSEMPFLANEGIAFDWISGYLEYHNVIIACNSERATNDIRNAFRGSYDITENMSAILERHIEDKVICLPNYYPLSTKKWKKIKSKEPLNIGCFGAIRPLKNQLVQAIAAIDYANEKERQIFFHINSGRVENKGGPVLENIRAVFKDQPYATLVEHPWKEHSEFKSLIGSMDVLMQVSFTETFNIVAADAVSMGVPVVSSTEISWSDDAYNASPTDTREISNKLCKIIFVHQYIPWLDDSQNGLKRYSKHAVKDWKNFING